MNDERKFDLRQYSAQPGSKWYLAKLIFYAVCLLFLGWLLYTQMSKNIQPPSEKIEEIRGVTIENGEN